MWNTEPLIILGGPGTGKTSYAMTIVDRLLGSGVKPHDIAFVSYTRKAVEEAKQRAADMFHLSRRGMENFRTIHSICYRDTGATRDNVMATRDYREVASMLGMRYRNRNDDSEEPTLDGSLDVHLTLDNYTRARMQDSKQVWDTLDTDFSWWEHKRVVDTVAEYKLDNGKRDFTDLLTDYLQHAPPLTAHAAILDEAQDLSTLQWKVAAKAFANVKELYIAGDDDQAIYRWSGADVDRFVALRGVEKVLPHSHRLSRSVHAEAQRLITHINTRREKHYGHTDNAGAVNWINHIDELPIEANGETWMLLARNKHLLHQFKDMCRTAGIPYRTASGTSMDPQHVRAIVGWERMRKGTGIDADLAAAVAECLGDETFVLPERNSYAAIDFPHPGRIWHDALLGINATDTAFYLNVLRNGFNITRTPPVYIGTIHSVKGGEADHVALVTDVSYKSFAAYQEYADDECRVFYVGVTRARNSLYLITPQTGLFFPI